MTTPLALFLGAGLALGSGCGSLEQDPAGERIEWRLRGNRIELADGPELARIAELEDQRSTGDGELFGFLTHSDEGVRARAALALGRLPYPEFGGEVTDALLPLLYDPVREVQRAAAFALGQRADPAYADELKRLLGHEDPWFRASLVEAAGRVPDTDLRRAVLDALQDPDLGVRNEAAVATGLWEVDAPDTPSQEEIDTALLASFEPDENGLVPASDFIWRGLYSLSRRRSSAGLEAFLEHSRSNHGLVRLFAVRGLARVNDPRCTIALVAALERALNVEPEDWRVGYEASAGLANTGDPAGIPPLATAVESSSAHVRARALRSLGSFPEHKAEVQPLLRRGLLDVSATVRVAALEALVRLIGFDEAAVLLREYARNENPVLRAAAASAAGSAGDEAALGVIEQLTRDNNLLVATTAIGALGAYPGPESRALLHEALRTGSAGDNGLRLAAIMTLREMPSAEDVAPLEEALRGSRGDISAEIAFNALENLGAIGGDRAEALVREYSEDDRSHVRRVARRVLEERFGISVPAVEPAPLASLGPPPRPGVDHPRWSYNPMVEVRTTRGSLVFELFPAETPFHVHSFLELVRSGHYDGLTFHRVVPDFVIQGGDYRGDGNGARPWRGTSLRHEFTPREYVRGSLGMPRNEDPDSGGSQFFVTHRPTPHLDGRYTLFGELRVGQDVLERIEVGDRILSASILP